MKLIAHRGLWNRHIKDNSYEAIKLALANPTYNGVEVDVRVTKDKEFILYHNHFYHNKLVNKTYFKEMPDVCRLESILKIPTSKIILLEIKDFSLNINKLINILNKYQRNVYLMSFSSKLMAKFQKKKVKYPLGVLNYVLNSDSQYDLDFICLLDCIASSSIIKNFQKRNIDVFIYGVINLDKNVKYIVDDHKVHKNVIKNNKSIV